MPDIATAAPVVVAEKAVAREVLGKRPRQGSGSRIYASFRSAIASLLAYRNEGLRAMMSVFSAAMVVMVTYMLLYDAHALLHIHFNAQERLLLLVGIGGVSFAAGGLIMMKVLLTLGKERSREFAVRLVVGARRCDVRNQLLFEVLLLSVIGGISGSACGLFSGFVLTLLLRLPLSVHPVQLLLLVGASIVPGIVCGLYPVRRALARPFLPLLLHCCDDFQ